MREHRFYDTLLGVGIDDRELAQYFEVHFLDEIISYNELVDGTVDLLNYLQDKGYKLHILSNGFNTVTNNKAKGSDIAKYFDTITSADEIGKLKPNPEIFEYTLAKSGAKKEESIYIGDSWSADVKGAIDFGIDIIYFDALKSGKKMEGLKVATSLSEIKKWL